MKHIAVAVAALATLSLSSVALADHVHAGHSILVSTHVLAPVYDASQPPVVIDPPILPGSLGGVLEATTGAPIHKHPVHHDQTHKKVGMFDKLKALERKKNAWLKRTFLGR